MADPPRSWLTIGALISGSPDAWSAARTLYLYLCEKNLQHAKALSVAGIAPSTVEDFRAVLPADPFELARACELGGAWAQGRRSTGDGDRWDPVVTGRGLDAKSFSRLTAETVIGIVMGARSTVRVFAPYVDVGGVQALESALVGATKRGVAVRFGYRASADRTGAVQSLSDAIAREGKIDWFAAFAIPAGDTFPHLKLVTADGRRAYIGSANLTYTGLTRNLEVGAVVEGTAVRVYEQVFESLIAEASGTATAPEEPE